MLWTLPRRMKKTAEWRRFCTVTASTIAPLYPQGERWGSRVVAFLFGNKQLTEKLRVSRHGVRRRKKASDQSENELGRISHPSSSPGGRKMIKTRLVG